MLLFVYRKTKWFSPNVSPRKLCWCQKVDGGVNKSTAVCLPKDYGDLGEVEEEEEIEDGTQLFVHVPFYILAASTASTQWNVSRRENHRMRDPMTKEMMGRWHPSPVLEFWSFLLISIFSSG